MNTAEISSVEAQKSAPRTNEEFDACLESLACSGALADPILVAWIEYWSLLFPVLREAEWTIVAVNDGETMGQEVSSLRHRKSLIYPCPPETENKLYALHEVLHVVFFVVKHFGPSTEEVAVWDLTDLILTAENKRTEY